MIGLIKTAVYAIVFGLLAAGILWILGNLFMFDVDFWYSARWLAVASFIFDIVASVIVHLVTDRDDNPRAIKVWWK